MAENTTPIAKPPWWHRLFWSEKSDHARLERELKSFRVELDLLRERTDRSKNAWRKALQGEAENVQTLLDAEDCKESEDPCAQAIRSEMKKVLARLQAEFDKEQGDPWAKAAHDEIENSQKYLDEERNIEGGWMSLHAARRHAIYGLSPDELLLQASMLRAEAKKIQSWRGEEMVKLLDVKDSELTVYRIVDATALRDEYFSNQYHKIWLVGSQITILLACCGAGLLLLFVPFLVSSSRQPQDTLNPWGYQMVGAVLFFGLLGAAFSAAGSLMNPNATAKIPERVANLFVTIARTFFGSGVGLAGYAMYQAKALNFHFGDDTSGPGSALAIAFLFGFTGELLIARVLGTLGSSQK